MKKILEWLSGGIIKDLGNIVDDLTTTKEEKEILKNRLVNMILQHALESNKLKAAIIGEEARGNFLQRSWRPIVMLAFAAVVVFQFFLYPVIKSFKPELPELPVLERPFWDLLMIGIGGYVVGRSAEKIVPQLSFNKSEK
ncbi:3TM-type holin [Flagellimonas sp. CMM7]|uniref:3TM-type holin n=1 Tax=Flagellimonas sp. CMM7 TaxID=2654676 RepID=UPI0013D78F61|nr:3TM-type holin [Flagellimonas sp. CMM7]UII79571.1 holin family protein [Flagellimonas sp. CMM7]